MTGRGEAAPENWNFFVSYTQADRLWAEWIAWQLEEEGYRVLVQAWDFVPGRHWVRSMEQGIRRAERTIAVLSHRYLSSVYASAEWQAAIAADPEGEARKLLVVRVERCEPQGLLASLVRIDLFDQAEEMARDRLLKGIRAAVAGRDKPTAKPMFPFAKPVSPDRRAVTHGPEFPGSSTTTDAHGDQIQSATDTPSTPVIHEDRDHRARTPVHPFIAGWRWFNGQSGGIQAVLALITLAITIGAPLYATKSFRRPPTGAPIALSNVTAIAAGWHHSLALLGDGTVEGWGHNEFGELGDGTTTNRDTPVRIPGLTDVVSISAGDYSLALLKDGTVKSWGKNDKGQLGDGSMINRLTPVTVPGLTDVVSISGGLFHALALLRDGTVKAWGYNEWGQLGDGTTTNRTTPVTVPGLTRVTSLSAALGYSMALLEDGTVKAWGANDWGTLGDGTTTQRLTPTAVSGLTNATTIATWGWHSLALLKDGTVRAWGNNSYGQLGDGSTTERHSPTPIPGLRNVRAISIAQGHSLALLRDETVRAWGNNEHGQLGDGTTMNRTTPTPIPDLSAVTAITARGGSTVMGHNLALLENGTVKAWGNNEHGQLGDGSTVNRTTPVTVLAPVAMRGAT